MDDARVIYQERWSWPQWVQVIYWSSMIACTYPLLAGWGTDSPLGTRLWIVAAIVAFFVVLIRLVGGLTIRVRPEHLEVFLGRVPLIRKRVAFGDIVSLESVRYHPLREFGGWGVRGFGKKQAWSARGDQAVVLHLVGGKQLYIGTDTPHRLEERIRTVAGAGLGANGAAGSSA